MESYRIMNDKWGHIQRQSDLALIPPTTENPDYVQFLKDKDAGAKVLLFDHVAEEARQAAAKIVSDTEKLIKEEEALILRQLAIDSLKTKGLL